MGQTTVAMRPRVLARPEGVLRRIMAIDEIGVIGALLAICIFLSIASDKFLQTTNLINVTRQASWFGIMAVGMVFVISMGDIDLSVGSILMLSSVCMALLLRDGHSIWLAMATGLAIGTACGFVNGTLS